MDAAGPAGHRVGTSTSSRSMSSGSASTTGPGRPEIATRKARATNSGKRAALSTCAAHLAIGPYRPVVDLLKGLASAMSRATWPMSRIIGVESWAAVWTPWRRSWRRGRA